MSLVVNLVDTRWPRLYGKIKDVESLDCSEETHVVDLINKLNNVVVNVFIIVNNIISQRNFKLSWFYIYIYLSCSRILGLLLALPLITIGSHDPLN